MNWLQKTSQSKPMALPFATPEIDMNKPERMRRGLNLIDKEMTQETADAEELRLNPEYLGSGGMGLAGITPEGFVVKWTKDQDEAAIAKEFIGKNVSCLPKFYEVEKLQDSLWAITMQKVELLPRKKEFFSIIRELSDMFNAPPDDFNQHLEEVTNLIAKFPYLEKIARDFNEMTYCLSMNKIVPGDLHIGNIGYNQGNMVLFDLGLSSLNNRFTNG